MFILSTAFFSVFSLLFLNFPIQNAVAETSATDVVSATDSTNTVPGDASEVELNQKISEKYTELTDLKKQIDTYEKQLTFTHTEAVTLQNTVKVLDISRQKMNTSIQLTQKQLESSMLKFTSLNMSIGDTEKKIVLINKSVAEMLRTLDQSDSRTTVEMVLSNGKLSEILDEGIQLTALREKVSNRVTELLAYKKSLVDKKALVEIEKKNLANYQSTLTDQKTLLDNAKKEKNDLLKLTKSRESDYQKILDINKAKAQMLEKELSDYESKLTRKLSGNEIPTSGSKILSWPITNPRVTQHFGITKDSVRLYASGTHNGVDLGVNSGTPITAAASGVIQGTGDTDVACPKASYGKWVLVKHDNGLTTLMAHFSLIKVSQGQRVVSGELLGYSGNTGYSTGPHLHISLFASDGVTVGTLPSKACSGRTFTMPLPTATNAYLDPEAYLPKI